MIGLFVFLWIIAGVQANRYMNKTMFFAYLTEYTELLNYNDIYIDSRCPLGGLYNAHLCTRTFSPACVAAGGGILVGGRCRRRTVPEWKVGAGDIDVCTLAGAGPRAYLNPNISRAAANNKSFLYCIDVIAALQPSPNLMVASAAYTGGESGIIGGGVGGIFGIVVIAGAIAAWSRRKQPKASQSVLRGLPVNTQINPIIRPVIRPLPQSRITELGYARNEFTPTRVRRYQKK